MLRSTFAPPLLAALVAASAVAQVPSGFDVDTLVAAGLSNPNDFCFLPDGRCLIANSAGAVTLYAAASLVTIGVVPQVQYGGELGLLSIAADPAFATNGYVYVYYSSTADQFMHLDRFTCVGDLGSAHSLNLQFAPNSRRVLLADLPDNSPYHNGGSVRFGPDGRLYVCTGDDGNACSAQAANSGCGCVLRLDVSAQPAGGSSVPPAHSAFDRGDNPLSASNDISQLVIAHGLRNPFRMEIDPVTGDLFLADVGDDAVEEVSHYVRGSGALPLVNFGWPWREGDVAGPGCSGTQPAGLVDPIQAMPHSSWWVSIIGGPCYRNLGKPFDFGPAYEGHVFVLEHWLGDLRRLMPGATGWVVAPAVSGQPAPLNWATNLVRPTSMRLGPDGGLWFTGYSTTGGTLGRVRPMGPLTGVLAISGNAQVAAAGDPFAQPLIVRALDSQGFPLGQTPVTFTVQGTGVSTPILTDWSGYAQANVSAAAEGGPVHVTASVAGSSTVATFQLFARKLTASGPGKKLRLRIENHTSASPPLVPYVVLMSFPGSPTVSTTFGSLCIDPTYALAVVMEDGIGAFGGVSLSGAGGTGTPSLARGYTVPTGLLAGHLMRFQAIGIDPLGGWFRTNCEQVQF